MLSGFRTSKCHIESYAMARTKADAVAKAKAKAKAATAAKSKPKAAPKPKPKTRIVLRPKPKPKAKQPGRKRKTCDGNPFDQPPDVDQRRLVFPRTNQPVASDADPGDDDDNESSSSEPTFHEDQPSQPDDEPTMEDGMPAETGNIAGTEPTLETTAAAADEQTDQPSQPVETTMEETTAETNMIADTEHAVDTHNAQHTDQPSQPAESTMVEAPAETKVIADTEPAVQTTAALAKSDSKQDEAIMEQNTQPHPGQFACTQVSSVPEAAEPQPPRFSQPVEHGQPAELQQPSPARENEPTKEHANTHTAGATQVCEHRTRDHKSHMSNMESQNIDTMDTDTQGDTAGVIANMGSSPQTKDRFH